MARRKIPGVYMIKIIPENKVYIGQSKDLIKRFNQYRWGATSNKVYSESDRTITKAIRRNGLENIKFIILASGDKYQDVNERLVCEAYMIDRYHADDPYYGYNETAGWDPGHLSARYQSLTERAKRAHPVYLYDTKRDNVLIFLFGTKGVGDFLGYGKDRMSHIANRGLMLEHRYYIFFMEDDKRHKVFYKLEKQRLENHNVPERAQKRTRNTHERYLAAWKRVCEIMEL